TNSTISNNSAGSGSGGGIWISFGGTVRVRNTIIAQNTASTGPDAAGAFSSQGHNLIGRNSNNTGFTNGVNGDIVGTLSQVNALLAPLANNGGTVQTMSLKGGSPALDAGDNCVTDVTHCGDPS